MQVAKAKAAAEARRQAERAELEKLAAERRAAGLASPSPEHQASPSHLHAAAVTRGSRDMLLHCMQPRRRTPCRPARDSWACRQHVFSFPKQHLLPCVSARPQGPACLLRQRPVGGPAGSMQAADKSHYRPLSCCLCICAHGLEAASDEAEGCSGSHHVGVTLTAGSNRIRHRQAGHHCEADLERFWRLSATLSKPLPDLAQSDNDAAVNSRT